MVRASLPVLGVKLPWTLPSEKAQKQLNTVPLYWSRSTKAKHGRTTYILFCVCGHSPHIEARLVNKLLVQETYCCYSDSLNLGYCIHTCTMCMWLRHWYGLLGSKWQHSRCDFQMSIINRTRNRFKKKKCCVSNFLSLSFLSIEPLMLLRFGSPFNNKKNIYIYIKQ